MEKNHLKKIGVIVVIILSASLLLYSLKNYGFTLLPFIFGAIMAYLVRVIADKIRELTGLNSKINRIICLILSYILMVVSLFFIGKKIAVEVSNFLFDFFNNKNVFETVLLYFDRVIRLFENKIEGEFLKEVSTSFKGFLGQIISNLSVKITSFATKFAISFPKIILSVSVAVISSFFILIDFDKIKRFMLCQLSIKTQKRISEIKNLMSDTFFKMIRCYTIIFAITFFELLVGLILFKVDKPFAIALIIAIADVLPIVGTGTVLIPWAAISFFDKNIAFAIGILALYFIIVVSRNIIEPKIIGEKLGLHPIISLFCMFIGLKLGGVILSILLPFTVIIIKYLNEKNIIHIYNNV